MLDEAPALALDRAEGDRELARDVGADDLRDRRGGTGVEVARAQEGPRVKLWEPSESCVVVKVAVPVESTGTTASGRPSSSNSTKPLLAAWPAEGVTVAVRVTVCPAMAGLGETESVVVVFAAATWITLATSRSAAPPKSCDVHAGRRQWAAASKTFVPMTSNPPWALACDRAVGDVAVAPVDRGRELARLGGRIGRRTWRQTPVKAVPTVAVALGVAFKVPFGPGRIGVASRIETGSG